MNPMQQFTRPIPFADHLGIRLLSKGGGSARLELDLRPELLNSWQSAHGGVTMTLLDIVMAVAARTRDEKALSASTVEMKVSFLAPANGRLVADGHCIHLGKSLAFCEGEARDADGKLVAKSSGTFMLRRDRGAAEDTLPGKA